ncbi:J domain-containing protein [Dehalococcoidia bacterium]|nr:J domain-containing protein [Dehalococcoidia bacterium]
MRGFKLAAKDFYQILGINQGASDKEIKQAYRKLARKYHPDVNPGDKSAESRFKEINEAHEVLSDPDQRQKYDQFGGKWQFAEQFAGAGAQQPYADFRQGGTVFEFSDLGKGGLGGIFENLFRDHTFDRTTHTRGRTRKRQSLEQPVELSLEEACSGTLRTVEMDGRRLEVKIPPGVSDGSRIRVAAGDGQQGGDIYLVITIKAHQHFERKGTDLHVEVPVPLTDTILGGEIEVPTPKGKLALKIPPETQNGKVFRLARQGMPQLGNSGKGDLFARVRVILPTNLTEREKDLFQELRSLRQ